MNIFEYISTSMAKGSIGAYVSVGLIALLAFCAFSGVLNGLRRGFSRSIIRLFTVGASAACSLYGVKWICRMIVDSATKATEKGAKTLADVLNSYFPQVVSSMPDAAQPIIQEIDAETATIFVMMVVAVVASPLIFIAIFQLLKAVTLVIYSLLSGLTGAIGVDNGPVSAILGAAVGLVQGVVIAAVMIFPISGLCGIAVDAREPLIGNTDKPNEYISKAYTTVVDDLATNPLFDLVDQYGGKALYEDMITIKINGEKMYMGDKCIGAIKVIADLSPIIEPGFNWKNPSDNHRQAFSNAVVDIGDDELVATLTADIMRGVSTAITEDKINTKLSGATEALLDDVMKMFSTSTKDTIEGDLNVVVDVYFIMCDRDLFHSFTDGAHTDMRDLLVTKGSDGKTTASVIIDRLNEYDRAVPIVTSFTKISLSVMHGTEGFGEEADVLYEKVKGGVADAISHNRSDYGTEEEYKAAVESDLDKALAENNINVDESTKANMVEHIANQYGDYEGEITDKEINDALLSYYESYASASQNTTPDPDPTDPDPGADE